MTLPDHNDGAEDEVVMIECRDVTKRFGGTTALDGVSVAFRSGEVHALVGENGAGKSTLGKVVAGVHQPDLGDVLIDGAPVSLRSPKVAFAHGITMVAQELSLVPGRSTIDNVFLGTEIARSGIVDRRASLRRFDELSEQYGMHVDPHVRVGDLPVAEQQGVEILRALARDARFIVMDEPTARLSKTEATALASNIGDLTERGIGVIYVSHFLDEVLEIADTVSVMRNGRIVRTVPAAEETKTTLVEGVAGRTLDAAFPNRRPNDPTHTPLLRVDALSGREVFRDVSFDVRPGEIVTLAGLVGSGRSEVVRTIFGADAATSGSMTLGGEPFAPSSPEAAIRAGVAMIPESRRTQGLFTRRSVKENITLTHLSRFARGGVVRRRPERRAATQAAAEVDLRGATIDSTMDVLSGGNQQKTLFARWMVERPRLLIADEPTRGVDVGAKRTIYDMIAQLASEGMGVLVVSSEIEEVLGLAHRILVMRGGRLVGELDGATADEADVMNLAFGNEAA